MQYLYHEVFPKTGKNKKQNDVTTNKLNALFPVYFTLVTVEVSKTTHA